jgi:RNA polymerase sigma-70 factor (ECF subfamily)
MFDENALRTLLQSRDYDAALTLTIRAYGPELLGWMDAQLKDSSQAREAFTWFAEDLWNSMRAFRGECTVRTWAYAVARNSVNRYRQRGRGGSFEAVVLSAISRASVLMVSPVTPDSSLAKEHQLGLIERLRGELTEDDQTLLTLRIDKGLNWREVAIVMQYAGQLPSDEVLLREEARLRKRFQLVKERLRKLAQEAAT